MDGDGTPAAAPRPARDGDTIDFFGASPPPTLPVPATAPPAAGPAAGAPAPVPVVEPVRRGVRVRTVVFGLVMLAVAVLSLLSVLTSVRLQGGVLALGILVGAGAALVLGGLTAAVRDVRRARHG